MVEPCGTDSGFARADPRSTSQLSLRGSRMPNRYRNFKRKLLPLLLSLLAIIGCESLTGVKPTPKGDPYAVTACANGLKAGDRYLIPWRSQLAIPTSVRDTVSGATAYFTIRFTYPPNYCVTYFDSLAVLGA